MQNTEDISLVDESSGSYLFVQSNPSIPFLTEPRDPMRQGLTTLRDQAYDKAHPLAVSSEADSAHGNSNCKTEMLQGVYGSALPARMSIERQILGKFERLPGLPSSKLGLESMNGTLDEFSFSSYLNLPNESEVAVQDMHNELEHRYGILKK